MMLYVNSYKVEGDMQIRVERCGETPKGGERAMMKKADTERATEEKEETP